MTEYTEDNKLDLVKKYVNDERNDKIDWNVGSLFIFDHLFYRIFDVCRELNINPHMNYVYGSTKCLFQGGRIQESVFDLDTAYHYIRGYNERGVGVRLAFSNPFLTKEDLNDEYCNSLLKYLNSANIMRKKNGVIVESDLLANHIKDKYSNLQIIASVSKPAIEVGYGRGKDTVDYYNKLIDKDLYDLVVINSFKIMDDIFLRNIHNKDKVEFIVNHRCVPDCPVSKLHYETIGKFNYALSKGKDISDINNTLTEINKYCKKVSHQYPFAGNSYSDEDVRKLITNGYRHFKLEGRTFGPETFLRDLGDYVFNYHLFIRLARSLMI